MGNRRATIVCAIVLAVWSLLPIYWIVNLSLQPEVGIHSIPSPLFPFQPNIGGYLAALYSLTANQGGFGPGSQFHQGYVNSLFVATMVMIFTMVLSVPSGYGVARFRFFFRTPFLFLIIFVRSIPPISMLVPLYDFYKITQIGTSLLGIILADMTLTVPLITWVCAGIFASIPRELDRQARVDGCSRFRVIWNVLIPVAAPGLIVVAVLSWLTSWNEWLFALFLADSRGIRMVSPLVSPAGAGASAFLVLTLIPPVLAAILLQRYMTRLNIIAPTDGMVGYGFTNSNS